MIATARTVSTDSARGSGRNPRRDKLGPDPAVQQQIVAAAIAITREHGVRGLSVASVLQRCQLGTRAFYRHFSSKDELVAALFLDLARAEARRLREKMQTSATAVDAVAAWIDGRLDLILDPHTESDLRLLSQEAQSLMFTSARLIHASFAEVLAPLITQLELGVIDGDFSEIDPQTSARFIHGAVWACTEWHWATDGIERSDVRASVMRGCLRALGVETTRIDSAISAGSSLSTNAEGSTSQKDG